MLAALFGRIGVVTIGIGLARAGLHGHIVDELAGFGMLGGQDAVDLASFVGVAKPGFTGPAEEIIGQAEPVVGDAGLLGTGTEGILEGVGFSPEFLVRTAAGDIISSPVNDVPEVFDGFTIIGFSGQFEGPGGAVEDGNGGIGMDIGKRSSLRARGSRTDF